MLGRTLEGYKGGEFMMGRNTPLWLAEWGRCGPAILGLSDDGHVITGDSVDG